MWLTLITCCVESSLISYRIQYLYDRLRRGRIWPNFDQYVSAGNGRIICCHGSGRSWVILLILFLTKNQYRKNIKKRMTDH